MEFLHYSIYFRTKVFNLQHRKSTENEMEYFHLTTPQRNIWNLQKYYSGTAIANLCGAVFFQERRDSKLLCQVVCQPERYSSALQRGGGTQAIYLGRD